MLYAVPTVTGKVLPPGAQVRVPGENAVEAQIIALGGEVHDTTRAEFIRSGKERDPSLRFTRAIPGYVLAEIPAAIYHEAVTVKGAYGTAMLIPKLAPVHRKKANCPYTAAMAFCDMLAAERGKARRIQGNRELVAEFVAGQRVEIMAGPLAGMFAEFQRVVSRAHDPHRKLVLSMGQFGAIEVDPLDVRAAS